MKLNYLPEPELEFGRGKAICPRLGIATHDVYDSIFTARRDKIHIGAIGTGETIFKFQQWLERCRSIIQGKASDKPELFPDFCGFNLGTGFKATLVFSDETARNLNNSDVRRLKQIKNTNERIESAVELYYTHAEFLSRHRVVDVIVCILPEEIYNEISKEEERVLDEAIEESVDDTFEFNFRRLLKAKAMHLGQPLQLMRELSFEPNAKKQQDEATKAWNFCTAIYYKANRTVPWKLAKDIHRPSVCYAGVSFFRSRDNRTLHTSLAQVFDELGNGFILRGSPVNLNRDDRTPHLTTEQAHALLTRALEQYRVALNTAPGRLVLHKSSYYNQAELEGFHAAVEEAQIHTVDFISINDTNLKLLRHGVYPPYRGMHLELDAQTHILYTRGFVKYYRTYPGLYVPKPLEVRIVEADESPDVICRELLSLTKMNWNNTQFDRKYPITIECSRRVGQIMKYVDPATTPQISYSYYM